MSIHTKTAIDAIKRSPFQAVSAIFVLSLTFFVSTMVAILVYSSGQTLSYFETRPQIITFLKENATPEIISGLQSKLAQDSRIKDLRFVSKDEALGIYKKATSDNPLLAELVSPSVFPASLEFSVVDLNLADKVISEMKEEAIVEEVGFTANVGGEKTLSDVVNKLKNISFYLKVSGIVFFSILALTSFVVLSVIISMRMATRKGEMEILSLIGATPSFIRSPIILEALFYSLIGVFTGWFLSLVLWLYLSPPIINYFAQVPIIPRDPLSFFFLFVVILAVELVAGTVISLTGSLLAVGRSLKKAR